MTERPRFSRLETFASNLNIAIHPRSQSPLPVFNIISYLAPESLVGCGHHWVSPVCLVGKNCPAPPENKKRLNGAVIHCCAMSRARGLRIRPLGPRFHGRLHRPVRTSSPYEARPK